MTPQKIDQLVILASEWVKQQRAVHRPHGAPLQEQELEVLNAYYDPVDLEVARVRVVPQIENPPWRDAVAAQLQAEGYPAIDFRHMEGITFVDTVLVSQVRGPRSKEDILPLLIHEMVHVVQYRLLGLERFMHDYVWGLANNGFKYLSIPFEVQAYAIQGRAAKGERFRVEPVLREKLTIP